jgi:hypothetical protein
MDFVTAASSLRATNYDIRVGGRLGADKMATKQIAGRIIPAVATTTAMTTSGVVLELIKYLQGHRHIDMCRTWYFDLDLSVFNTWAPNDCLHHRGPDRQEADGYSGGFGQRGGRAGWRGRGRGG